MKRFILAILMLLALPIVSASENYNIDTVNINDIEAEGKLIQVELDTKLDIEVLFHGTGQTKDVKVRAFIGGYEYGSLEENTEMFDIENGVNYKKTLSIEIPENLKVSDHEYTLYVQIYDSNELVQKEFKIYFEEPRHKISVKEIMTSTAFSDSYLGVKLRLTNLGENKEEDIRVTVSIPELGISTVTYVDELAARGKDNYNINDEITTQTMYLKLPTQANGDYELKVQVDYNEDSSRTEDSKYIRIDGYTSFDETALVSVSQLKNLKVGKESEFKIQITNLDSNPEKFYIEVDGDFVLDYTKELTVSNTQEIIVNAIPNSEGSQSLRVKVYTDSGIVKEEIYSYEVKEQASFFPILLGVILAFATLFIAFIAIKFLRE